MWGAESLYNMIPVAVPAQRRAPLFKSSHSPTEAPYGSTLAVAKAGKKGTFGAPIGGSRPNPSVYLKKNSAVPLQKPRAHKDHAPSRMIPVPRRDERPVMGLQSTKNYVTANAVEAILAVPGNRARVNPGAPEYRNKADYGKVPAYLQDVKEEINRENQMIQEYMNGANQDQYEEYNDDADLDSDELENLIDALKTKWDNTNKKYQKMCHMVKLDTIGKVRRKEAMESELDQLEKDIQKLEGSR